jgi:hypothetical protein
VPWIALYVGLAVIGLAVLGVLTLRLWHQVRDFGRTVGAAGARIAQASEELSRVAPPPRG